jgi:hypothetical protein
MPKPRNARGAGHVRPLRSRPADHVTILSSLWKMFERSGAVSAYIAYRRQLSRVVRETSVSADGLPFTDRVG